MLSVRLLCAAVLLYVIQEVSEVKRLRRSFDIMTVALPFHCQHNEDVT